MRPGRIERREHEYIRHGTVNVLVALLVPTGKMKAGCLEVNNGLHLRPALHQRFRSLRRRRRVHLIWADGGRHIARDTATRLRRYRPWVRVVQTPAHASWLNQAELLLRAFGERYLVRGDWASRLYLRDHELRSCDEYN